MRLISARVNVPERSHSSHSSSVSSSRYATVSAIASDEGEDTRAVKLTRHRGRGDAAPGMRRSSPVIRDPLASNAAHQLLACNARTLLTLHDAPVAQPYGHGAPPAGAPGPTVRAQLRPSEERRADMCQTRRVAGCPASRPHAAQAPEGATDVRCQRRAYVRRAGACRRGLHVVELLLQEAEVRDKLVH